MYICVYLSIHMCVYTYLHNHVCKTYCFDLNSALVTLIMVKYL